MLSAFSSPECTVEADVFQYVFLHEQIEMLENHSYFLSLFAGVLWGENSLRDFPSINTFPSDGTSRKFIHRTRVLFPAPDIPMIP